MHWGRTDDRFGIAYVWHGLSPEHRDYLAAGGIGFVLGDGKLNYGLEQILETSLPSSTRSVCSTESGFSIYSKHQGITVTVGLLKYILCAFALTINLSGRRIYNEHIYTTLLPFPQDV